VSDQINRIQTRKAVEFCYIYLAPVSLSFCSILLESKSFATISSKINETGGGVGKKKKKKWPGVKAQGEGYSMLCLEREKERENALLLSFGPDGTGMLVEPII
jgi:hypothetical protein